MFDQLVIEKLDFYVYCLMDPRNNEPFYIGKGVGNRIFDHEKCAIKSNFLWIQPFVHGLRDQCMD